jgi:hypothetical protein
MGTVYNPSNGVQRGIDMMKRIDPVTRTGGFAGYTNE